MDLYTLIQQALKDTSQQYLLEQSPSKGDETPVLNVHLFAEQVAERVMSLHRQSLEVGEKDVEMMQMMKAEGGSFVKALAAAMFYAGSEEYAKLVDAFPEYVSDYKQRAHER